MENEDDKNGNGQLILDSRIKTKKPSMYKVIMLNDDYTPMEFVVHVLSSTDLDSGAMGAPESSQICQNEAENSKLSALFWTAWAASGHPLGHRIRSQTKI